MTGRKIVDGAIEEGILGLEKMQWVRMARKTLHCFLFILAGENWERGGMKLTCHAKGTFFIFARRIAKAAIRE
jgi:hypothetical protein